jgi:orotidine 5'-phosphate decarboxylase subfamily 1
MRPSFTTRAELQRNTVAKNLFLLMDRKRTNLALSLDVTSKKEAIRIADALGDQICVLKTHIDVIEDADRELAETWVALGKKHDFFIFEDRKFADIGNTVRLQYQNGPFKIASWTDIANFHLISGPGVLQGLVSAGGKSERGFLVLSQMSSKGHLMSPDYTEKTVRFAEENSDHVIGFICQNRQSEDLRFINMTPGVSLSESRDELGQQYRTPRQAIVEEECDIIIVGRGIIGSSDIQATARQYRSAAWAAYESAVSAV